MKKNYKNKGFMMVEVVIAASIIVVCVLAAMGVAQKSVAVSRQALHSSQAAFLLEEGVEAMRILRDGSWANISGLSTATNYYLVFSGGTWTLSATPGVVDIFTRRITVANVNRDSVTNDIAAAGTNDVGTKLITVTVSWLEGGQTITKTLPFYLMDIFS